jgi:hypothetical protein
MARPRVKVCKQGHKLFEVGVYWSVNTNYKGHRIWRRKCAECARIAQRKYRKRIGIVYGQS